MRYYEVQSLNVNSEVDLQAEVLSNWHNKGYKLIKIIKQNSKEYNRILFYFKLRKKVNKCKPEV